MKEQGKIKLDNGAEILYNTTNQDSVVACMVVGSGSAVEPYDKRGLAHILEHMTFQGSKRYPTKGSVDKAASHLGFRPNADTSLTRIRYHSRVPRERYGLALELLADCAFNPVIRGKVLSREKKIVQNECRRFYDLLQNQIHCLFNQAFFRGTPYEELTIGREDHISGITRADLKKYHKTNFVPSNIRVFLYGGVDDDVLNRTKETLSNIPSGKPVEKFKLSLPELLSSERTERYLPGIRQAYGIVAFRTPNDDHPDNPIGNVIDNILRGNGKSSVFKRIREVLNLAYDVSTLNHSEDDFGYSGVQFDCGPEDLDKSIEEILKQITNLSPSEAELEQAKSMMRTNNQLFLEDPGNRFDIFLNEQIYDFSYAERFDKMMNVTRDDVKRYVREYFTEKPHQIVVLRPPIKSAA